MTAEHQRLAANAKKPIPLEQWGPYLSERQWGTVREDYGYYGDAWGYLPFDQSHFRTYQWVSVGNQGVVSECVWLGEGEVEAGVEGGLQFQTRADELIRECVF